MTEMDSNAEKDMINVINCQNLEFKEKIAAGGMGQVSRYLLYENGKVTDVAVKTIIDRRVSNSELTRFRKEIEILSLIEHKHIVRTLGMIETKDGLGIVLEYLPFGSYANYFASFWDKVPSNKKEQVQRDVVPFKIRLLAQVIDAMVYLHGREIEILHLDLKSENVLLTTALDAKICDFGLSKMLTVTELSIAIKGKKSSIEGTPFYIAPELLEPNQRPTSKCDVYSFGIFMYTVLADRPPYSGVHEVPNIYPDDLMFMMKICRKREPSDRPEFADLRRKMRDITASISDFDFKAKDSVQIITSYRKPKRQVALIIGIMLAAIAITGAVVTIVLTQTIVSTYVGATQCSALQPPTNGSIECQNRNTTVYCSITCKEGYFIEGSDTVTCVDGSWTNGGFSCRAGCPAINQDEDVNVSCSDDSFVGSVCKYNCTHQHKTRLQGTSSLTCLNNSTWSDSEPKCVCANPCSVGDNCSLSSSWAKVNNELHEVEIPTAITVIYAANSIVCSVSAVLHYGHLVFIGYCRDAELRNEESCKYFTSPRTAARSAAAELIRTMVKKNLYPKPCDYDDLNPICDYDPLN